MEKDLLSTKKQKYNQPKNIFKKKQCRTNIYRDKKNIQWNKSKQNPTIIK